ncbi:immunity 53 family protein [Adhaeribacter soli]|uniref:Uncharacterized protein n=1 Tax=Adhaeribacter soli TaxID=2607655 RepID=A0A5N1IU85_9BACT|nr:immunity 53 family protein [Adhaeribacter soli]KAA9333580.1 hypothetical protein F0P94_10005 [Adhaeribacter soli]
MADKLLDRIQDWYRNNCNGDWEHGFGIKIETVDNPGWSVEIELEDTALENAQLRKQYDNGAEDWLFIEIKQKKFLGAGDPNKLNEIFRIFLDEVLLLQIDSSFTYPIFVPIPNMITPVWKEVTAKVINESTFEIVEIPETTFQKLQILKIDDFQNVEIASLSDLDYKIGDKVRCKLKEFFEGVKPVVVEKIKE